MGKSTLLPSVFPSLVSPLMEGEEPIHWRFINPLFGAQGSTRLPHQQFPLGKTALCVLPIKSGHFAGAPGFFKVFFLGGGGDICMEIHPADREEPANPSSCRMLIHFPAWEVQNSLTHETLCPVLHPPAFPLSLCDLSMHNTYSPSS